MNPPTGQSHAHNRMPIAIAGAALTAFAALYVTGGHFIGLPILGALLALSYATRWRLPEPRWYGYLLRVLLMGTIFFVVGMPSDDASFWYFKPEYTSLAGYMLAAELVVQTWRWRDWQDPPEAAGVALVLTALIISAAADTYRHQEIQLFSLLYTAMMILSLRTMNMVRKPARHTWGLTALRATAIALALALGYGGVAAVNRYDYRITSLAMRLLNRRTAPNAIGLSDTPHLGAVFNPAPLLDRVMLIDGNLDDPHLRAIAFDRFDDGRWLPTLHDRQFFPVGAAQLGATAPGDRAQCSLLSEESSLILAPLDSVGIDVPTAVDRDGEGVLQTHDAQSSLVYDIVSPRTLHFQGPLCAAPSGTQRARLLAEPAQLDPGVIALAQQVAGTGDARSRVERLAHDLRQTHAYSLVFTPHGDPISDFILNHRAAHCEYFASAMVVLCRAVGVPARFVTGYYAHEREGSHLVVRARDAHAWAECWIDGVGWIVLDATPSDGTPDALYPKTPQWRTWLEMLIDLPKTVKSWFAKANRKVIWAMAGGAIGLGILVGMARSLLRRRRLRRARHRGYAVSDPELIVAARRFERALRNRGVVLTPHRTWRESIAAMPDAEVYLQFVAVYESARFGARPNGQTVRELLHKIEGSGRAAKSVLQT